MSKLNRKPKNGKQQNGSGTNSAKPAKRLYRDNLKVTLVVDSYTRSKKDPVQINGTVDSITVSQSVTFPSLSIEDYMEDMVKFVNVNNANKPNFQPLTGGEDHHVILQRYLATICLNLGQLSVVKRQEPGQLLYRPSSSRDEEGNSSTQ
jgi:ABC-type Mn2+/Zn2+ transport system ATPase subunit